MRKITEDDNYLDAPAPMPELTQDRDAIRNIFCGLSGEGLRYHTYSDIGKYTLFYDNHWKRMFPSETFGGFDSLEFEKNNVRAIMAREEGV